MKNKIKYFNSFIHEIIQRLLLITTIFALITSFACSDRDSTKRISVIAELDSLWDTMRVVRNPHMGMYYHYIDFETDYWNVPDSSIENIPGMDHIYIRLSWALLQPEKDWYNWEHIDTIVEKWIDKGYGISFRISCFNPYVIQYATPKWVVDEGARGKQLIVDGRKYWLPDYLDPIFLKYLAQFHQKFAEKYDGKKYIRYIDIGSVGCWGEGHPCGGGDPITYEIIKTHVDLYLQAYKKTPLVAVDDFVRNLMDSPYKEKEILGYLTKNNVWMRDDSPLVAWYVQNVKPYCIYSPQYFDPLYLKLPIILEAAHYSHVLDEGIWLGENGCEVIPEADMNGAEIFKGAIKTLHASYIGFHGHADKWLKDNPDVGNELVNLCGYRYYPLAAKHVKQTNRGSTLNLSIDWMNGGVAPAYHKYRLLIKLEGSNVNQVIDRSEESDNLEWLPGKIISEDYSIDVSKRLIKGEYKIKVKMETEDLGKKCTVELPMKLSLRDQEGFYTISSVMIR